MTRIVLASLAVAAFIVAALLHGDRKARADLEFEDQIRTALHPVEDPDETARREQQERISAMLAAVLADWDDPTFGAFCERQFIPPSRVTRRPE